MDQQQPGPSNLGSEQTGASQFQGDNPGNNVRRRYDSRGRGRGRGSYQRNRHFRSSNHNDKFQDSGPKEKETTHVVDPPLADDPTTNWRMRPRDENIRPGPANSRRGHGQRRNRWTQPNRSHINESRESSDKSLQEQRANQTREDNDQKHSDVTSNRPDSSLCDNIVEEPSEADSPKHVIRRFIRDRNPPKARSDLQIDSTEIVQSEISEHQFKSNTFECMICCDNIHRSSPIWYCTSCYNIFHLKCAIEWCNKCIKSRDEAIANAQFPSLGESSSDRQNSRTGANGFNSYRNERQKSIEWPCPTCRKVLHSRPGKYKCFCGKVVRPELNRHLTPHSCGQLCGRKRPDTDCPHACNTICHPGRCNTCTLNSKKSCFCGKLTKDVKCSSQIGSCGDICAKDLNCKRHICTKVCHDGACDPCSHMTTLICFCGSKELSKKCDEQKKSKVPKEYEFKFSCDKLCDKILDCNKHRCIERCHPGPECPSCHLLSKNLRTCPCGSTSISNAILEKRISCLDPLPTCDNKCNRQLICGPDKSKHRCQKRCHTGPCPPCKLKTTLKCDCLMSSRTVDCALMFVKVTADDEDSVGFKQHRYSFTCETRCNNLKNCKKHRCQEKCCDALRNPNSMSHICNQVCNKRLPCGTHNCQETCHAGLCGDCTNIGWSELSCHCGASIMYPPIPCGAKPPVCHRPCRRAHECGHPVKHECHDDMEKCAPCTVFVRKSCFCGSDSKESVYCYLPGYSCGRTCKKTLNCKKHVCKRVCHDGDCEVPNERGVIVCQQPCQNVRFVCKHPCNLPCHGNQPCPSTTCSKIIEISCECGNRTDRIECFKLTRDTDNRNKMAMLSMNRPNQDSVVIDLSRNATTSQKSSKPSAEAGNSAAAAAITTRKLECDDTCAIYKRNKALAEALDIAQPDLKPASIFGEDPLKLLREATTRDYKFLAASYNSLAKLVKSAKESERRFVFLQFPPADKLKREVLHELAYHFNCTSESRDDEPERFVIVRASKNKSSKPDFTIEQLLPADV